jgi:hypothetical protein
MHFVSIGVLIINIAWLDMRVDMRTAWLLHHDRSCSHSSTMHSTEDLDEVGKESRFQSEIPHGIN